MSITGGEYYMTRMLHYIRCEKCGYSTLIPGQFCSTTKCKKCNVLMKYSSEIENAWLNELDEYGQRKRMDFTGKTEEECRKSAATYFKCAKEDVQDYYIVQPAGLLKKCIICATRPVEYEEDKDAIRILMWEFDHRPRIWADINLNEKTILYPQSLGDEKQKFDKIVELIKCEDTGACKNFKLILEPQGEINFMFFPGYFNYIDTLIQLVNSNTKSLKKDWYKIFFTSYSPENTEQVSNLELSCSDCILKGRAFYWKKAGYLSFQYPELYQELDISIDKIKYFRLVGQKYVTTDISGGGGGGSSLTGALIGGLIAGEVGAIIGSRKEIDEVKGTSIVHDEQMILIYSNDLKNIISLSSNAYEILTKLIPEKEYEVVIGSENKEQTTADVKLVADAVREYKKLFDEGIINVDEYEKKKKELLGL